MQSVEDAPVFQPKAKYTDAVIGYQWEYQFLGIDGDDGQVVSIFETNTLPEWLNLEIVESEGNVSGRLHGVLISVILVHGKLSSEWKTI